MDETKLAKLPRWAQREIERLRANVTYWKETATSVTSGSSRVFIGSLHSDKRYLPDNEPITFMLGEGSRNEVSVSIRQDRDGGEKYLDVNSHGSRLTIEPNAANSIRVQAAS